MLYLPIQLCVDDPPVDVGRDVGSRVVKKEGDAQITQSLLGLTLSKETGPVEEGLGSVGVEVNRGR